MSNASYQVSTPQAPSTLGDLISSLRTIFESDRVNIEEVGDLLKSYKSNPRDWKQFAKFDRFRYTRNLIDEGNGKYNLMLLCWGEGHGSAIHDHADSHCFMKVMQGSLSEVRFSWPEKTSSSEGESEGKSDDETEDLKPMTELSRTLLPTDGVCYINDSLGLHRVENTSYSDTAVSLHLYCPPFEECSVFNQRTGHRSRAKVTFWSRYGNKPSIVTSKSSTGGERFRCEDIIIRPDDDVFTSKALAPRTRLASDDGLFDKSVEEDHPPEDN